MAIPSRIPVTEQNVRESLRTVKYPGYNRDIVSFGIVKTIAVVGNDVTVTLQMAARDPSVPGQIQKDVETALAACDGVGRVQVEIHHQTPAPIAMPASRMNGVRRIVAVGSGKGGVGKSTVAVNLACALAEMGQKVGLLDADIYGPSLPKMLGMLNRPTLTDDKLDPVESFGLKMISMALLLERDTPVLWRGPMIMKAIQEFTGSVNWGELDVLMVDLPPGTGDAQLSLVQTVAVDGGVIVTTPQDVALDVTRRGIQMFEKVHVKILGIVENMSYYLCPHCHQHDDVFGHGGARREAERLQVPFLGEIPLLTGIRVSGDQGVPVVRAEPTGEPALAFRRCAETLWKHLENTVAKE